VAALVAGAKYLDAASSQYALALADDWNQRIEEWCYVAGSSLDSLFGLDGHYVRIGPDPQSGLARIASQPYPNYEVAASSVLGLEFAYLARLGLRSATDKKLSGQTELNFIRRYGSTWDPSGNHAVPIVAVATSHLQHQSGR